MAQGSIRGSASTTHTVWTSTIASPSQAPTASIVAASSPSNSAIDQLWRGLGSFESSASESLGEIEPKSVEAPNPTLSEFAKYAVKLSRTGNGSGSSADRADKSVPCPCRNCLRSEAPSKGYGG